MINPFESYRRINPCIYSFKYILNVLKLPIMFGMSVYEYFVNLNKENDLLYEPIGEFLGFHAVVIAGYNDQNQCMDILNSHGIEFGDNGFFRMSYKYILNPDLCFDFYVINASSN